MTEKEYIDLYECRDDFYATVLDILSEDNTNNRANQIIDAFDCLPTADVEPVRHGHWITDSIEFYKLLNAKGVPLEEQPYLTSDCVACSECLRVINCMDNCMEDALYCKYCGAKMGEENI